MFLQNNVHGRKVKRRSWRSEQSQIKMSLVTIERPFDQCNGETMKAFKQWKDVIRFQKIAMAVERSMIGGGQDWTMETS